jgi:hypothetical protein
MKKYFAKNLPLLGRYEIKEGDKVLHLPSGKVIDCKYQSVIDRMKGKKSLDDYKPLRLFLVSKDIRKGDWVYHVEGNYGAVQSIRNGLYNVRYENSFNSTAVIDELFGVYALISPKAKWIKDGNPIDAKSIGNPIEKLIVNPFAKMPVNVFCEIYPIKCPCCDTFK